MVETVRTIQYLLETLFPDSLSFPDSATLESVRDAIVSLAARSVRSVKEFGPLGSDANNLATFQAALDHGGLLLAPAGNYNFADALLPRSNAALIGEGVSTSLTTSNTDDVGVLFRHFDGTAVSNFVLANMSLSTALSGGDLVGLALVLVDHSTADSWKLHKLHFSCPGIGLNAVTAVVGDYQKSFKAVTISECVFDDVGRMGVELLNQFPLWTATTPYAVNDLVGPATTNGFDYRVTAITTGISGGSEPTWPTTVGGTVTNGGVTFTCMAPQYNISKFNLLRNTFRNIGVITDGWAHSISGRAHGNLIGFNIFEGTAGSTILLENAGASYSTYIGNRFFDWGSKVPLSVSDVPPGMTGNLYIGNTFSGPDATGAIRIAESIKCKFSDNSLNFASALLLVGCTDCEISENIIISSADNFVGIDGGTGNRIVNNLIDNTRAAFNTSGTVLFNGAAGCLVVHNRYHLHSGGTQGVLNSGAGSGNLLTPNFVYDGSAWSSV